jgi:hypothetical protein
MNRFQWWIWLLKFKIDYKRLTLKSIKLEIYHGIRARRKVKVGQLCQAFVMFDKYDFRIVAYSESLKKYQLQWLNGKGTFWVTEDKIIPP